MPIAVVPIAVTGMPIAVVPIAIVPIAVVPIAVHLFSSPDTNFDGGGGSGEQRNQQVAWEGRDKVRLVFASCFGFGW